MFVWHLSPHSSQELPGSFRKSPEKQAMFAKMMGPEVIIWARRFESYLFGSFQVSSLLFQPTQLLTLVQAETPRQSRASIFEKSPVPRQNRISSRHII